MEIGQILERNGVFMEVCESPEQKCSFCVAFGKQALCNKLPDCGMNKYFRKLNSFDIRKIKKAKKEIISI